MIGAKFCVLFTLGVARSTIATIATVATVAAVVADNTDNTGNTDNTRQLLLIEFQINSI